MNFSARDERGESEAADIRLDAARPPVAGGDLPDIVWTPLDLQPAQPTRDWKRFSASLVLTAALHAGALALAVMAGSAALDEPVILEVPVEIIALEPEAEPTVAEAPQEAPQPVAQPVTPAEDPPKAIEPEQAKVDPPPPEPEPDKVEPPPEPDVVEAKSELTPPETATTRQEPPPLIEPVPSEPEQVIAALPPPEPEPPPVLPIPRVETPPPPAAKPPPRQVRPEPKPEREEPRKPAPQPRKVEEKRPEPRPAARPGADHPAPQQRPAAQSGPATGAPNRGEAPKPAANGPGGRASASLANFQNTTAIRGSRQGTVRVTVSPSGQVTSVSLVSSSGDAAADRTILAQARGMHINRPAGNTATTFIVPIKVRFQ